MAIVIPCPAGNVRSAVKWTSRSLTISVGQVSDEPGGYGGNGVETGGGSSRGF